MGAPFGDDTKPRNRKEIAFCQAYLKHFSAEQAWRDAGYSVKRNGWGKQAKNMANRFAAHLEPLVDAQSKAVAIRHAITLDAVMEEMRAVAFVNPDDYFISEPMPRKPGHFKIVQKGWHELTREQKAACEITRDMFGNITGYKLPALKVKHAYLQSLGQQLGGFLPAAIQARALANQGDERVDLSGVPTAQLEQLREQLLAICPPETARALGLTFDGEFKEVK